MLSFLVRRPIAVLTTFSGLLLLGGVVLQQLPISLLPDIPIPQISVQINYPNTGVRTLENTVVRPLRNQLLQVGNLTDIQSNSRNSSATIALTFDFGTNINLAFIEVNEKIDQILGTLPKDLPRPQVLKTNAANIPVLELSIYPKDPQQQSPLALAQFTQSVIKRRLEQLPTVAFVDRNGFALPEIQIIPNKAVLKSLSISDRLLVQALEENNVALGSILVQDGQYQYNIRLASTLTSVEDIAQIYLNHEGKLFQLKDLAKVQLVEQARRGKYFYDGHEAIVLNVRKQADAQLFALKAAVEELIIDFEADYPDLNFVVTNDQSELLSVSIDNLKSSLLYGAFFAFVILFLFFREWQAPLLIGLVIPSTLMITILGFYLVGLSINTISLSGLILGIGLMIDNAIIVIENIRQYRSAGYATTEACIVGANEVIRPLISSALTTCSVFLPLIFLSGIGGVLFYDQAVSISLALMTSLLIAYLLLPTLIRLVSTKSKRPPLEVINRNTIANQPFRWYPQTVDFVLNFRLGTMLLFVLLIIAGISCWRQLPQENFPPLERAGLRVKIDWNEAINLTTNEQYNLALIQQMDTLVGAYTLSVGESQFLLATEPTAINESDLILYTPYRIKYVQQAIQNYFQQFHPNATISVSPLRTIFDELFIAQSALFVLQVQATNSQETPILADTKPIFEFLDERSIFYSLPAEETIYNVKILTEKALIYQVSYQTIYNRLKTLLNQNQIGILKSSEAFIPISIGHEPQALYALLQSATVYNQMGDLLPLVDFVEIQKTNAYKNIVAGKTGELLPIPLDTFSNTLQNDLKTYAVNVPNLQLSFSGQIFEQQQNLKELSIILVIVVILLYLILAAQFESLLLPFLVMLTVPVGISGTILTLYLMQESINLVAIIGMIVMSGIVVNDAILKIDRMEKERAKHTLEQAIHIAGQRRLKPIIMTSFTTILALLPILFSEGLGATLQRPLALAVIGGLLVGTIASLYFIPVLYLLLIQMTNSSDKKIKT